MKKKSIWEWITIWSLILIVSIGACYSMYAVTCYRNGIDAMDRHNFIAAQRNFNKVPILAHFCADDLAYVEAGVLMEQGQYLEALDAFESLNNYPVSVTVLEKLAKGIINEEEPFMALQKINAIKNLSLPSSLFESLKDEVYTLGQHAYQTASYAAALEYFELIGDYKRATDYLFLIEYKFKMLENSGRSPTQATTNDYTRLVQLIGFEDAANVLIKNKNFLKEFLRGRWEESGSHRYFAMDENYFCTYNLPTLYVSGQYYYLDLGIYSVGDSEDESTRMFKFEIVDKNTILVYCYQDESTYQLCRQ